MTEPEPNPFIGKIREILPEELVGMDVLDAENSPYFESLEDMAFVQGDGKHGFIKIGPDGKTYGWLEKPSWERPMKVELPEEDQMSSRLSMWWGYGFGVWRRR